MQVFTAKVEYAVRAVSELAGRDSAGPVQCREIASRQAIPEPYLDQLLSMLRRAGIVRSVRGPSGGYVLNRRPHEITLGDVVRACCGEEPLGSPPSLSTSPALSPTTACVVRGLRERIERAVSQILEETTIRDLLEQCRQLDEAQAAMFHI